MPACFAHSATLGYSLRRGFVVVLAAATLYSLAAKPVGAAPPGKPKPPDQKERKGSPVDPDKKYLADQKKLAALGKKKSELKKKIADLEKGFLESVYGKNAKAKIADAKNKRDKKVEKENSTFNTIYKNENKKDQACCVWTPDQIKKAHDSMIKRINNALNEFIEQRRKIISEKLSKLYPSEFAEYKKLLDNLKNAEKEYAKVSQMLYSPPPPPPPPRVPPKKCKRDGLLGGVKCVKEKMGE